MTYNGIIVVDKPAGARSTSCVGAVKHLLGPKQRIGHAGTLDSTAQGVLVLLLGNATRLSNAVMNLPKQYLATVQLGWETDTDDGSGAPLSQPQPVEVPHQTLKEALLSFLGTRLQRPPRISAVRVDGVRSHRLARSGEEAQPTPRPVSIQSIDYLGPLPEKGQFQLRVACHRGTYIRSLARDIGQILGTGAHLCSLRRLAVGDYRGEGALVLDPQNPPFRQDLLDQIRPVSTLAGQYCTYEANGFCEGRLVNGLGVYLQRMELRSLGKVSVHEGIVAMGPTRLCLGRLDRQGAMGILYPQTIIPLEVTLP